MDAWRNDEAVDVGVVARQRRGEMEEDRSRLRKPKCVLHGWRVGKPRRGNGMAAKSGGRMRRHDELEVVEGMTLLIWKENQQKSYKRRKKERGGKIINPSSSEHSSEAVEGFTKKRKIYREGKGLFSLKKKEAN